jgi:hypothetical protein
MSKLMFCVLTAGVFSLASAPVVADEHDHGAHMLACAKVCAACQIECDNCYAHCKKHVEMGHKEHAASMQLCVDCADACKVAATLAARQSPLSADVCDFCAKACDKCAAECEKHKEDPRMTQCAKSCRECAKACRDMIEKMKK